MPDVFISEPKPEPADVEKPAVEKPASGHHANHTKALSNSLPHPEDLQAPGIFSAYTPNPKGITFLNQEEDETLLLFLRRHFITNIPWIAFTILLILLPPLYFLLLNIFDFRFFPVPPAFTFVIVTFYYLFVASYALGRYIVWFYHVGIVTPHRLLDLDLDNVLKFDMAEAQLGEIVDVSYEQRGFFQSFFDYGNVHIQTEAIHAKFQFEQTPHPATVADIITDLQPKLKKKHDA